MEEGWRLYKKSFHSGAGYYALYVTKDIMDEYGKDKQLCAYIGEHTDGGHSNGYEVECYPLKGRAKKIPKRFKPHLTDKLKILEFKPVTRYSLCVVEEIKMPMTPYVKKIIDKALKENKAAVEIRKMMIDQKFPYCGLVWDYIEEKTKKII